MTGFLRKARLLGLTYTSDLYNFKEVPETSASTNSATSAGEIHCNDWSLTTVLRRDECELLARLNPEMVAEQTLVQLVQGFMPLDGDRQGHQRRALTWRR